MPPLEARGIELAAQRAERAAARRTRRCGPEASAAAPAQEMHHQLGRAFGGLERDIAGEAIGHDDIDRAFGDVVAFDETANSIGSFAPRRICAAPRTASLPFWSSEPTLRRPTVGRSRPRMARANASPITAKSTSCCASRWTLAPTSSTTLCPRLVGQNAAMAGRSRPSIDAQLKHRHRHQRAGVAGGDRDLGFLLRDALDGAPHAGVAAAAQRLARLVFHARRVRRSGGFRRAGQAWGAWRTAASAPPRRHARETSPPDGATIERASAVTTMPGPASPPIASIETVRSRAHPASLPMRRPNHRAAPAKPVQPLAFSTSRPS